MRFILEVMMLAKHLEIWWLSHLLEQNTYRYKGPGLLVLTSWSFYHIDIKRNRNIDEIRIFFENPDRNT